MKFPFKFFITFLTLISLDNYKSLCARINSSRTSTSSRTILSSSSSNQEQTKSDCISKYIAALDKECYNTVNVNKGGVYADCSSMTIPEFYDAMDMQIGRIVGNDELADFLKNCTAYKGEALTQWLGAKNVIETSAVKASDDCIFATEKLNAAKKCYTAALAHDGNFFEFENLMQATCGTYPDVAQKFSDAGNLGLANLPKLLQNYSTLQFTSKSENWRNAVEAILADYIYQAKAACGEDNYDIIEFNNFAPDNQENLLSIAKENFAAQFGQQLGSRTENLLSSGKPTVGTPTQALNKDTILGKTVSTFYENMGWKQAVKSGNYREVIENQKFGNTTPQTKDAYLIQNVFVIDGVNSLNNAKARLANIIKTGDLGAYTSQDSLDSIIINALGGRSGNDASIYNILADLSDGDTFIIKQDNGMCMVLILKNEQLNTLNNHEVDNLPALYDYLKGCNDLAE